MRRHTRSFWEQRVREVEQGAPAEQVARRHGLKLTTLRWWRSALRRDQPPPLPALLPVVVRAEPASALAPRAASPVEIAVGGVQLRVAVGTDVAYVAALVGALGGRC